MFDGDHAGGETLAEELTQVRMGKIVGAKFPELDADDQEAVRQHAIAALNLTQKAKEIALSTEDDAQATGNTRLLMACGNCDGRA